MLNFDLHKYYAIDTCRLVINTRKWPKIGACIDQIDPLPLLMTHQVQHLSMRKVTGYDKHYVIKSAKLSNSENDGKTVWWLIQ